MAYVFLSNLLALLTYNHIFFPAGVRMYFSVCPFKHPFARPSTLTLIHIRLPPGFSAASNVEKPSKVHRALYSKGKSCRWQMFIFVNQVEQG